MPTRKFTREELYQAVWLTPMAKLSGTFGLSDVGLAKICRKHDIPVPPPGYWAKLRAGQNVVKPELPISTSSETIRIHITEEQKRSGMKEKRTIIHVADSLVNCHELVKIAKEKVAGSIVNESGVSEPSSSFNIKVSRSQLERTLRILDALFKHAISEGFEACTGPAIKLFDETIAFRIEELLDEVQSESDKPPQLEGRYEFHHSRFDVKHVPSGRLLLMLDVDRGVMPSRFTHRWTDTNKKHLELQLGTFFDQVHALAKRIRDKKQERSRLDKASVEQARVRSRKSSEWQQVLREKEKEQQKLDELIEQCEGYRLSKEIRQFVEVFVKHKRSYVTDAKYLEWMESWAEWALMQADRLDPTRPSPPSVLDAQMPKELRPWQIG